VPAPVIARAPEPSTFAITIWKVFPLRVAHAMRSPFGDHAGDVL